MRASLPSIVRPVMLLRVTLIALAVVVGSAFYAIVKSDGDATRATQEAADVIAKNLDLQVIRIQTGFDTAKRFPDWDYLVDLLLKDGTCARYVNNAADVIRSSCAGRDTASAAAPEWFAVVYALAAVPARIADHPLAAHSKWSGRVIVTSDPRAAISRAWQRVTRGLAATIIGAVVLALLFEIALYLSLRPIRHLAAGLDRAVRGDLEHRLPIFGMTECRRIGDSINQVLASLRTTRCDHAELSAQLINAQEQERRYLARELHDDLGQSLAAISALAASIEMTAQDVCPVLSSETQMLSQISMTIMQKLRNALQQIGLATLDEYGLVPSLHELITDWNRNIGSHIRFEFNSDGSYTDIPSDCATHVFRIAQEGLTNAVKHGAPRNVTVTLKRKCSPLPPSHTTEILDLIIEDNGRGFSAGEQPRSGQGLKGIRQRTVALGGTIQLTSEKGRGTRLCVSIPVRARKSINTGEPSVRQARMVH